MRLPADFPFQNSVVLYANYLNPYQTSFLDAAKRLNDGLETG